MNSRPLTSIVNTVLAESRNGGIVHDHLSRQAAWEGRMRTGFASLVAGIAAPSQDSLQRAEERLRYLNGAYNTRYPVESLPCAASVLVRFIDDHGWWRTAPPELLDGSDEDAAQLAEFVASVLDAIEEEGCKRPFSLLTKFLHFCFPDSFPICDSQAAASIQMWSYLAFDDRGADWQRYRWWEMTHTSGRGYRAVVDFYRLFWSAAGKTQRVQLGENADSLTDLIGGRVSTLDLIDKLLWLASGDPLPLGLIEALG